MADLPLEGRQKSESKKTVQTQEIPHEQVHRVSQRALTQEELKKLQDERKESGYRLQLNKTVYGNELAIIAELLSAVNGNLASLAISLREIKDHLKGEKGGGSLKQG